MIEDDDDDDDDDDRCDDDDDDDDDDDETMKHALISFSDNNRSLTASLCSSEPVDVQK